MSNLSVKQAIANAVDFIKSSNHLLVGSGAGMGKDSGMPDFRGNQGFWNSYPPYKNKFKFVECANPAFLEAHPHLFWGFYGSRLDMYRKTKPHRGFNILKGIANQKESNFIITSNVDGHFNNLFSETVYQVHGSIHHLQCGTCQTLISNTFQPDVDYEQMNCLNLPQCKTCKQIMRPNILMFGDWQWDDSRSSDQEARYSKFCRNNLASSVVMLEFGCGTAVPTIRNMLERYYYQNKHVKMIRVNPDEDFSRGLMEAGRYVHLKMGALQALEAIEKEFIIG